MFLYSEMLTQLYFFAFAVTCCCRWS